MNHHAHIQVNNIDITMPHQRYVRLLNDEIIAVVEQRKYAQQRNAVMSYAFASIIAVAATLVAINGLLVF